MTVDETPQYRSRRREWTRTEILDAAWEVARRDGVAALSLREVAALVGMRAPSLYHYFPSKTALYDAMYAQGMDRFAAEVQAGPAGRDSAETLRNRARRFVAAAVADPVRYELLFHRPVPGFVPSEEHVGMALAVLGQTREVAAAAGIASQQAFDLFMATTRGLIAMQIANEPGGDRWTRLVDEAVEILIAHYRRQAARTGGHTPRRQRSVHPDGQPPDKPNRGGPP
jgi:AcrR family transcriptional regulator